MPAKGTAKIGAAQRTAIARGKVAGKAHKAIARETGLAPDTVRRQFHDPRTVSLIQRLKAQHEARLGRCFSRAVTTIENGLKSRHQNAVCDARRDLVRILNAGETQRIEIPQGDCQLEELLAVYRRVSVAAQ